MMLRLLLLITILIGFQDLVKCQSFLLGDENPNYPTKIKSYNNTSNYIAITTEEGGKIFSSIVKTSFDGQILWQHRIPGESTIRDFVITSVEEIIIVGRTEPFHDTSGPQDNTSIILKLDANGNLLMGLEFDLPGRESFECVAEHNIPADPEFPFYVIGTKNRVQNSPSSEDISFILNFSDTFKFKWATEFKHPDGTEIHRGLTTIPDGKGALIITGNIESGGRGSLVKLDGNDGSILIAKESLEVIDFYKGADEPGQNMTFCVVGEFFDEDDGYMGFLNYDLVFNGGTRWLNSSNSVDFYVGPGNSQYVALWSQVENRPFLQHVNGSPGSRNVLGPASLDYKEDSFKFYVDQNSNSDISYSDGRMTNSGLGDMDAFITNFTIGNEMDVCTEPAVSITQGDPTITLIDSPVTQSSFTLPDPIEIIALLPSNLESKEVCIPTSIDDNSKDEFDLLLSPNPVSEILIVEAKGFEPKIIIVKSIDGKEIIQRTYSGNDTKIELDVSNIPQGIYFIQVGDKQNGFQIQSFCKI